KSGSRHLPQARSTAGLVAGGNTHRGNGLAFPVLPATASQRLPQRHNRRAPAAGFRRSVPEAGHKIGTGQDGADRFALHADASAVNDAHEAEAAFPRQRQVLFDYRRDVAGRHAVQVEHVGDGNRDGIVSVHNTISGSSSNRNAQPGMPAGRRITELRAPDVRRPAVSGAGSRSLPSGPSNGVSTSSSGSLPTVHRWRDEESLRGRPVSGQNLSAGWRACETPRWYPSGALSTAPVRSVP